jgi:hypothetical protein
MISSPLLSNTYQRFLPDYHVYTQRMDEDQTARQKEASGAS